MATTTRFGSASSAPESGDIAFPPPGSLAEKRRFDQLQRRLPQIFQRLFPDPRAPQTIVVVPSMSLHEDELPKLAGACRYEERLLCLLMLLRRPGIRIVYLSSQRIAPAIVDYSLRMLRGVSAVEARRRLTLLDCGDDSAVPLTGKLLARPWLVDRIRDAIPDADAAHMTCFNSTPLERTLAVRLGIPLYGCDPDLLHLGTKSGSRAVFRAAGIAMPAGYESLRDVHDVARALYALKRRDPQLRRAVVKLDAGFSGEGNALFAFDGAPAGTTLLPWIVQQLPVRLRFVAPGESWEPFREKYGKMGGVVECFVEGEHARSPSVQCRIDPMGTERIISTHDQVLGGESGQVFLGCTFPADAAYATRLHEAGLRVTRVLRQAGVLGRFGIDFISHLHHGEWRHSALEINLRKGGTTHPYLALQLLTDGDYGVGTGEYVTASGRPRCYRASDNIGGDACRGLAPADMIDIATANGLHFDAAAERGVMFHLLGALPDHGKLGAICIAEDRAAAARLYDEALATIDREVSRLRPAAAFAPGRPPLGTRSVAPAHGVRTRRMPFPHLLGNPRDEHLMVAET
jgi:hypothetical protein